MHALLNGNSEDDILFVQEPWFGRIGTARDDVLHSGKSVLGGAANAQWTLHNPHFTNRAKVMTYIRIHDRSHPFCLNKCRGTMRLDLCAHPSILITDITIGQAYWHTINFYHDVDDPSSLTTLLSLDLDPTIPTLLIRDFNTHSASWSPLGWTKSHWADRVEEYMATQTYTLLSVPRIPTHRGEAGARDSTIDLVMTLTHTERTYFSFLFPISGSPISPFLISVPVTRV